MIEKIGKNVGAQIAGQVSAALEEKMNPKTEWHRFNCDVGHKFAVEILTGITTKKIMEYYDTMRCPMCYSKDLTKEANL